MSAVDPTPLYPFGHGLSYADFSWDELCVDGQAPSVDEPVRWSTSGQLAVSITVRNEGSRADADVVQLYLHDPVAQVTRPVMRLIGYARVALAAGESRRVTFDLSADLSAFTGRDGRRVVEAGEVELRLSSSSVNVRHTVAAVLTGPQRVVDHRRQLTAEVTVS